MTTPNSHRSLRKHPGFRRLCLLVVLACLLAVTPAAAAPPASPAQDTPTAPIVQPLDEFLNPDGTLALPAGQAVSLDPRSYRLVSGPGEVPRFAPAQSHTNPGDENWASDLFGWPGTNGAIVALAVDAAGNLYAGGLFTAAGAVSANYIAKWDGSAWSTLGSGLSGTDYPHVNALAVDTTGNLYAGGRFTAAGAVSANYIAKWDGTAWSTLGSGMNGDVDALAVDGSGDLYAGGAFTTAGGVSANGIARWDGTTWSALGSGMGGSNPRVGALALDAVGNLYAGGDFTAAGGISANKIAKWNGTAWSALGSGMNYFVVALAVDAAGNLYAGGGFTTAGGMSANYIAKWDGTAWSALGSGMGGGGVYPVVWVLALDAAGNLYAGGNFIFAGGGSADSIAKWDGTAWSSLGSGVNAVVNDLAVDAAGNLYTGGGFTNAGGVSARYVAKWDGTTWSALGSGVSGAGYPNVVALAADAAGNLYAGGFFTTAGGVTANAIAKWDGTAWSALGSGMGDTDYPQVNALAVDAAGNLYAGGYFTTAGGMSARYIAKWDGTAWSALGSGMGGTDYPQVDTLAVNAAGNLYAGGDFTTAGWVSANHVAKWNGTDWSALGGGMNDYVTALAVDPAGNLYAGGYFTTAGGVNASRIAKWNGSAWSALGSGMNGSVRALALDTAGNLYAGGYFTTAGGVNASYISKWDGAAWSAMGSGMNNAVHALAVDAAGNLYAGGYFTTAGGVSISRIAKWDGTAWSALGSGMNGPVYALVVDAAGNLYAGGYFTMAGDHVSTYVARWTAADGAHSVTTGSYTLYANNLPVTIDVVTPGTLNRLTVQRFNRSHPQATASLATGYYWEIVGTDASGNPATGYVVDLTLPTTFTPGADDRICRYTGSAWDCAATAYTANSITRTGISELSDWTVQNIACLGDFDGDGDVDIVDVQRVAYRWGSHCGDGLYDPLYDTDNDCDIDILDVQRVAYRWGTVCTAEAGSLPVLPNPVQLTDPAILSIQPVSATVASGDVFTVTVAISDVVDLGAFEFTLGYNPALIEGQAAVLGPFPTSTGRTFIPTGPTINNTTGTLTFGAFSLGASPPGASGAGALALVRLRARTIGTATLQFSSAQLANVPGTSIPVTLQSGTRVIIPCRGDVNGDGQVDIFDIQATADRWNINVGAPGYDPRYNLDSDGNIDVVDIQIVDGRWGATCHLEELGF